MKVMNRNRVFAILVALVLLISISSQYVGTAYAASIGGIELEIISEWAYDEVHEAERLGLTPLELNGNYQGDCNRNDFCTMIMQTLMVNYNVDYLDELIKQVGLTGSASDKVFKDTDNPSINAAYILGIVNGVGGNKFNPNGSITRQEAATMLVRASKYFIIEEYAEPLQYKDMDKVAKWAKENVVTVSTFMSSWGTRVMQGMGEGKFGPLGVYTREQAICSIFRLFKCSH